eukprot:1146150-Pelagomonas_calceolata.AAC.2
MNAALHRSTLQRGGALVIRRLCGFMGAEAVFTELAGTLHEEPDLTFAATMVQKSKAKRQCLCCGLRTFSGQFSLPLDSCIIGSLTLSKANLLSFLLCSQSDFIDEPGGARTAGEATRCCSTLASSAIDQPGGEGAEEKAARRCYAPAHSAIHQYGGCLQSRSCAPQRVQNFVRGMRPAAGVGIVRELGNVACASVHARAVAATPEACVVSGRELQQKQHQQGPALFAALYPCWAHSSGALLSLCLLAQVGL